MIMEVLEHMTWTCRSQMKPCLVHADDADDADAVRVLREVIEMELEEVVELKRARHRQLAWEKSFGWEASLVIAMAIEVILPTAIVVAVGRAMRRMHWRGSTGRMWNNKVDVDYYWGCCCCRRLCDVYIEEGTVVDVDVVVVGLVGGIAFVACGDGGRQLQSVRMKKNVRSECNQLGPGVERRKHGRTYACGDRNCGRWWRRCDCNADIGANQRASSGLIPIGLCGQCAWWGWRGWWGWPWR